MEISGRNGKRTVCVADATRDRVIDYIAHNPGQTPVAYAKHLLVAPLTVNLLIERYLMDMASAGRIAVSDRGSKPNWYHMVPDRSIVPIVSTRQKPLTVPLHGIADKGLRADYNGLVTNYDGVAGRHLSPAKQAKARQEFVKRVEYAGTHHQATIDTSNAALTEMKMEMKGLKEAINVLANHMKHAA